MCVYITCNKRRAYFITNCIAVGNQLYNAQAFLQFSPTAVATTIPCTRHPCISLNQLLSYLLCTDSNPSARRTRYRYRISQTSASRCSVIGSDHMRRLPCGIKCAANGTLIATMTPRFCTLVLWSSHLCESFSHISVSHSLLSHMLFSLWFSHLSLTSPVGSQLSLAVLSCPPTLSLYFSLLLPALSCQSVFQDPVRTYFSQGLPRPSGLQEFAHFSSGCRHYRRCQQPIQKHNVYIYLTLHIHIPSSSLQLFIQCNQLSNVDC